MHTVRSMNWSNVLQATRLGDASRRYEYEGDTDMDIKDNISLKDANPSERNIGSHHGSPVPCLAKYVHGWGGVDWNWISRPGFLKLPYLTYDWPQPGDPRTILSKPYTFAPSIPQS